MANYHLEQSKKFQRSGSSASAFTAAYQTNVKQGSKLIATIALGNSGITSTVVDNLNAGGGTWTLVSRAQQGTSNVEQWKFENTAAGACTLTITPSASAFISVVVGEWSGGLAIAAQDQTNSNAAGTVANGGTATTNNVTTSSNGELYVASFDDDANAVTAIAVESGWTDIGTSVATATTEGISMQALGADTVQASGTYAGTWVCTVSSGTKIYTAVIASYLPAQDAVPPPVSPSYLMVPALYDDFDD